MKALCSTQETISKKWRFQRSAKRMIARDWWLYPMNRFQTKAQGEPADPALQQVRLVPQRVIVPQQVMVPLVELAEQAVVA
jgi:hypothetical protein